MQGQKIRNTFCLFMGRNPCVMLSPHDASRAGWVPERCPNQSLRIRSRAGRRRSLGVRGRRIPELFCKFNFFFGVSDYMHNQQTHPSPQISTNLSAAPNPAYWLGFTTPFSSGQIVITVAGRSIGRASEDWRTTP